MAETRAERNEKQNKNKKKKVSGAVERDRESERDRLTFLIKNNVDLLLLFFNEKKIAHTVQHHCFDLLKPEFYGVGPSKLLGHIHASTRF